MHPVRISHLLSGSSPPGDEHASALARANAERLEAITLFSDLEADRRARIAEIAAELEVAAGDAVVREGDFDAALLAVVERRATETLDAG